MISIKSWPPPNHTQIKSITGRSQLQFLKVLLYKEEGSLPKACWHFLSHKGELTPWVSGMERFFSHFPWSPILFCFVFLMFPASIL
jgi:hypothetical protein